MEDNNNYCAYEIQKFMCLLCNSNPTVLETLYIDDEFILYEHPAFTELKKHRDEFVTKQCFRSFMGYASSQINKATGYNKMCTSPVTEKKGPLDFCYTFYNQGSTKLINWLNNNGYKQKYCGLVKVPNMHDVYGVYYDWKADYEDNGFVGMNASVYAKMVLLKYDQKERLGYSGIVAEDGSSNTLRYIQDNCVGHDGVMLNSVEKGEKPICYMSFNADGYAKHLRDYTRYQKWLKERNPDRFALNKGKGFDAKNMSECFRLIDMGIEIAKGEGVKVNRRHIDRNFLLDVKYHMYSYEELMTVLTEKERYMKRIMMESKLPDNIDTEMVNQVLINIRKEFYGRNI